MWYSLQQQFNWIKECQHYFIQFLVLFNRCCLVDFLFILRSLFLKLFGCIDMLVIYGNLSTVYGCYLAGMLTFVSRITLSKMVCLSIPGKKIYKIEIDSEQYYRGNDENCFLIYFSSASFQNFGMVTCRVWLFQGHGH